MKIFCVIPAYNEEDNIENVVRDVKKYIDNIIVVDDCSDDNTSHQAEKQGVTVLRHPVNRGQGAALQTGNTYALSRGADIIVHFDADGQFLAKEIQPLTKPIIRGEADACFGSRFLTKRSELPLLKEKLILPLAGLVNRIFFNIRTTDPQNGFRALSRQVAGNIEIEQDQMAHCSEILHKVHKHGFRVKEVPVTVIYHEYGQKFSGGIKIIKDIIIKGLSNK
jgi:glycosyltransferase involved in cell wall biosynthesis